MPAQLTIPAISQIEASTIAGVEHFGGNTLVTFEEMISAWNNGETPELSSLVSTFGTAGVTTFRYPGGTVTERYVDVSPYGEEEIVEPTRFIADGDRVVEIINLQQFFQTVGLYQEQSGNETNVMFVIPTRGAYEGNPAEISHDGTIDEGRPVNDDFINDAIGYVRYAIQQAYANGVAINVFELGNEFFDDNGANMTAREYGVVSGRLIAGLSEMFQEEQISDILNAWGGEPDIIVQGVHHSGGGNITSDWANLSILQGILDIDVDGSVVSMIDGYTSHYHFDASFDDVNDSHQQALIAVPEFWDGTYELRKFAAFYGERRGAEWVITEEEALIAREIYSEFFSYIENPEDLHFSVTEWSVQHADDSPSYYGLQQTNMMVELFYEMLTNNVDSAYYWPLAANNMNTVSGGLVDGNDLENARDQGLSIHGIAFRWMSDSLQGLSAYLDAEISAEVTGSNDLNIHAFGNIENGVENADQFVFFVANSGDAEISGEVLDASLAMPELAGEGEFFVVSSLLSDGEGDGMTAAAEPISEYLDGGMFADLSALALNTMDGWGLQRIEISYVSEANDYVVGRDGNDNIRGEGGNDTLIGGAGNDVLKGQEGDDSLRGGHGRDELIGGWGNDAIDAGNGNDVAYGGGNSDTVWGGEGNDSIYGEEGNDQLWGNNDNDELFGGLGVDTLIGGEGDDSLSGNEWSDVIFGGEGDDFINGGFGFDRLNGGAGADRFYHRGVEGHGTDWIQDYSADEADVLQFDGAAAADDFLVQFADVAGAGDAGIEEAFVTYRPTGQILWALIDGAAQDSISVLANGVEYDLIA